MKLKYLLFSWILLDFIVFKKSEGKSYIDDLTLNSQEKFALDKFKEIVGPKLPEGEKYDYMREDIYLIRWLRAKNFDLKEAETMLLDDLRWREKQGMENIQQEDFSDIKEYKYFLDSRSIDGKPLLYVNVGAWNLRKAVILGRRERLLRYVDKAIDEVRLLVRELGSKYHNVSQAILILNVQDFSLAEHGCLQCISILLRVIFSYETHFPGLADKLYVINVPALAEPIVQTARAALRLDTNKILNIYGKNPKIWRKALLADFTLDELPSEIGGKKRYKGLEEDEDDYNL